MRYLARKHDLYGNGDVEATMVDMIHEGHNDLRKKYITMIYQNYVSLYYQVIEQFLFIYHDSSPMKIFFSLTSSFFTNLSGSRKTALH